MDCSRGFATPSGAIKRANSPTFFNLVPIPSSPRADIDRHLFVVLWAFSSSHPWWGREALARVSNKFPYCKLHCLEESSFPIVDSDYGQNTECRRIDVFELWCWRRLLGVPWTSRRSNQSILQISPECSLKGGRTGVEAETPILWPPHVKSWLIGKDPDAGKDWGQEEKGTTDDEMVGWHHQLNGQEFG